MKRASKLTLLALAVVVIISSLILFVAHHNTAIIFVTDESGTPIGGASVTPQSLTVNYPTEVTDGEDSVRLPMEIQKIKWVYVQKNGYEDYHSGDIDGNSRITVVLKKAAK